MDDLNKIAPNLSRIKKEIPFRTPEQYFETFPERLGKTIHEQEKSSGSNNYLRIFRPYLAAAVIIIVALAGGSRIYKHISSIRHEKQLTTEISLLVEKELYSFSEQSLFESIEYDAISEEPVLQPDPEEVIDYLMNEDLNEVELYNTL
jgi:hypothetical protein